MKILTNFLLFSVLLLWGAQEAHAQCNPSFTTTVTGGNTVYFNGAPPTGMAYNNNDTYTWYVHDFTVGVHDTLHGRTPVYQFSAANHYYVCLDYTSAATGCTGYFCDTVAVTANNCAATNVHLQMVLDSNGMVQATATATGFPGTPTYVWSSGDSSAATSFLPNSTNGGFCITVSDGNCTEIVCDSVPGFTGCQFVPSISRTGSGNTLNFQSSVAGGSGNFQYYWYYTTASGITTMGFNNNLSYTFPTLSTGRTYPVHLRVSDRINYCSNTVVDSVYVPGTHVSCNDNPLELEFQMDNFANEISWLIFNVNTWATVASGSYTTADNGRLVLEDLCLPDGCYSLQVNDSWGDGLCCNYGAGSFQLTDNTTNTVLATGAQFGHSVMVNFCVGRTVTPCQTLQNTWILFNQGANGQMNLSTTLPAGTPVTYDWQVFSSTGTLTSTLASPTFTLPNGVADVVLTLSDSLCSVTLTDSILVTSNPPNLSTCMGIVPDMNIYQDSTDPYLIYVVPTMANVPVGYNFQFTWQFGSSVYSGFPAHRFNGYGTFQVCYTAVDPLQNCTVTFCDSITIDSLGTFSRAPMNKFTGQTLPPVISYLTSVDDAAATAFQLEAYPNPAQDVLNLDVRSAEALDGTVTILDLTGRPLQQTIVQQVAGQTTLQLDVAHLPAGLYLVRLHSDTEQQTVRFVKQ